MSYLVGGDNESRPVVLLAIIRAQVRLIKAGMRTIMITWNMVLHQDGEVVEGDLTSTVGSIAGDVVYPQRVLSRWVHINAEYRRLENKVQRKDSQKTHMHT